MSFQTGTQSELLYSSIADATALATFTTEDQLQKTLAPVIIPGGFFYNAGATGKSLKVKAAGWLNAVSVAPTFTFTVGLMASTVVWTTGRLALASTAALTSVIVTQAWWFMDIDIICRSVGVGALSSVSTTGEIRSPLGLASPFAGSFPASNVSPVVSTVDNSLAYYLFLSAACQTSNGSNSLQLRSLKVYGEN